MVDIEKLCHLDCVAEYILTDKKYQRLNPYQKENIILSLFHSANWNKINKIDRAIILQEVENIEAKKIHREPFQFVLLKSTYKWDDFLMDFGVNYTQKKIYSRKNYIEDGIYQKVVGNKIEKGKASALNLYFLDSIFHEQYHIMTRHYLNAYFHMNSILYREHAEHLMWWCSSETKKLYNNQEMMRNRRYIYRMFPDEYYAFSYAEQKMSHTFTKLNSFYGLDENWNLYLEKIRMEKENTIISYQNNCKDSNPLTYDELYQKSLNEYIASYAMDEDISVSEVENRLKLQKSIINEKLYLRK